MGDGVSDYDRQLEMSKRDGSYPPPVPQLTPTDHLRLQLADALEQYADVSNAPEWMQVPGYWDQAEAWVLGVKAAAAVIRG